MTKINIEVKTKELIKFLKELENEGCTHNSSPKQQPYTHFCKDTAREQELFAREIDEEVASAIASVKNSKEKYSLVGVVLDYHYGDEDFLVINDKEIDSDEAVNLFLHFITEGLETQGSWEQWEIKRLRSKLGEV